MTSIVIHGGAGIKLRPLTHTGPKQLISIANRLVSQYVLEGLLEGGIKDITIVLGDTYPEKVKEQYVNIAFFNTKIKYIYKVSQRE